MRGDIIYQKDIFQADRQMQHPSDVNRLGALKFRDQANHPEEQKRQDHEVPHKQHYLWRLSYLAEKAQQNAAERACDGDDITNHHHDHRQYGVELAAAGPLISNQPLPQPDRNGPVGVSGAQWASPQPRSVG